MRIGISVLVVGWTIGCCWSVQASGQSVPSPAVKPLQGFVKSPVSERDVLPPKKPTPNSNPVADRGITFACELPFAKFTKVPPVRSDDGCGFDKAVVITALKTPDGGTIRLSSPVTVSCEFAALFSEWGVSDASTIAGRLLGSPISVIHTGPGYQCRRRNNLPDGKLSEHALGKAVDVSGFQTLNGQQVSVETDWPSDTASGTFLKEVHASACQRFTTVLGPDADPNHKSHFHLDTGCHGKDCTYLICQ